MTYNTQFLATTKKKKKKKTWIHGIHMYVYIRQTGFILSLQKGMHSSLTWQNIYYVCKERLNSYHSTKINQANNQLSHYLAEHNKDHNI